MNSNWRDRAARSIAASKGATKNNLIVSLDENTGEVIYPDGVPSPRAVIPMALAANGDFGALAMIPLDDDRASIGECARRGPIMVLRFHRFGGTLITGYAECLPEGMPLCHAVTVLQSVRQTRKDKTYYNPRLVKHPWGSLADDDDLMDALVARIDAAEAAAHDVISARPSPVLRRRKF